MPPDRWSMQERVVVAMLAVLGGYGTGAAGEEGAGEKTKDFDSGRPLHGLGGGEGSRRLAGGAGGMVAAGRVTRVATAKARRRRGQGRLEPAADQRVRGLQDQPPRWGVAKTRR